MTTGAVPVAGGVSFCVPAVVDRVPDDTVADLALVPVLGEVDLDTAVPDTGCDVSSVDVPVDVGSPVVSVLTIKTDRDRTFRSVPAVPVLDVGVGVGAGVGVGVGVGEGPGLGAGGVGVGEGPGVGVGVGEGPGVGVGEGPGVGVGGGVGEGPGVGVGLGVGGGDATELFTRTVTGCDINVLPYWSCATA